MLALLTEHLTNATIAERLVVSEKTIDHHVSAVLRKLDVHSRPTPAPPPSGSDSPPQNREHPP